MSSVPGCPGAGQVRVVMLGEGTGDDITGVEVMEDVDLRSLAVTGVGGLYSGGLSARVTAVSITWNDAEHDEHSIPLF